jgi:hypothetical protein
LLFPAILSLAMPDKGNTSADRKSLIVNNLIANKIES